MTTARQLKSLVKLQVLREKRAELALLGAIETEREASEAHANAALELQSASSLLESVTSRDTLNLDLMKLAGEQLSQSDQRHQMTRRILDQNTDYATTSREEWHLAKLQREALEDKQKGELRRDQKRSERVQHDEHNSQRAAHRKDVLL